MNKEKVNALLPAQLEAARNASGVTQAGLAQRLNVTPQMVSYLEKAGSDIRLSVLTEWAEALGLEPALVPARRRTLIVDADGSVLVLRQMNKHAFVTGPGRVAAARALLELIPGTWLYHGSLLGQWLPGNAVEIERFDKKAFDDGSRYGALVLDVDAVDHAQILRTFEDLKRKRWGRWVLILLSAKRETVPTDIALEVALHLHADGRNVYRCTPTSAKPEDSVYLGKLLDTLGTRVPAHSEHDGVLLGEDHGGNPVFLEPEDLYTHASIFGDVDSRREAARGIVAGLVDAGWDATIVNLEDGRSEPQSNSWMKTYAKHHQVAYSEATLRPENALRIDPYAGLSVETITAILMASQEFEAPYYQAMAEHVVQQAVVLLRAANQAGVKLGVRVAPTIRQVGSLLSFSASDLSRAARELLAAAQKAGSELTETDIEALLQPGKSTIEAAAGSGARLMRTASSRAAENVLVVKPGGAAVLDVNGRGVTYLGLDSWGQPELSDLILETVARRIVAGPEDTPSGNSSARRVILIEGAHTARQDTIVYLLARARAQGVSIILAGPVPSTATGKVDDVRTAGTKDTQIRTWNTNVRIAFGRDREEWLKAGEDAIGDDLEIFSGLGDDEAVLVVVKPRKRPANDSRTANGPVKLKLRARKPHETWVGK